MKENTKEDETKTLPKTTTATASSSDKSAAETSENSTSAAKPAAAVETVQPDQKVLNDHAEEVAARKKEAVVEGGKEFVGSGIHKGREIKNGVIDYSTPSDREKMAA